MALISPMQMASFSSAFAENDLLRRDSEDATYTPKVIARGHGGTIICVGVLYDGTVVLVYERSVNNVDPSLKLSADKYDVVEKNLFDASKQILIEASTDAGIDVASITLLEKQKPKKTFQFEIADGFENIVARRLKTLIQRPITSGQRLYEIIDELDEYLFLNPEHRSIAEKAVRESFKFDKTEVSSDSSEPIHNVSTAKETIETGSPWGNFDSDPLTERFAEIQRAYKQREVNPAVDRLAVDRAIARSLLGQTELRADPNIDLILKLVQSGTISATIAFDVVDAIKRVKVENKSLSPYNPNLLNEVFGQIAKSLESLREKAEKSDDPGALAAEFRAEALAILDEFLPGSEAEAEEAARIYYQNLETIQAKKRKKWSEEMKHSKAEGKRDPAQFIREEFAEELVAGILCRSMLSSVDFPLSKAYGNWIKPDRNPTDTVNFATEPKMKKRRKSHPKKKPPVSPAKSYARYAKDRKMLSK